MSDLVSVVENWYKVILLAKRFPEYFGFWDKLFSSRARKQHFEEKRFLKEKELQIFTIVHALSSVVVFKQIPNPPKSEIEKVISSLKRAIAMDPNLFETNHDNLVEDALSFLQKYNKM